MKEKIYKNSMVLICFFCFQITLYAQSLTFNPLIQKMVDSVKTDTISNHLISLQTKERYTPNANAQLTANYLKSYLMHMGFDTVYFQTYPIAGHSYVAPNIIAIKYGEINPDSVFMACAHWDTYQSGAPGADDNGSGTVSVLETARILTKNNFKKTLRFCLFSGEELGLYGSLAYVSSLNSDKIGAVLNLDMVSYQAVGQPLRIGVFPKSGMLGLYNKINVLQQTYVPGIQIGMENGCPYDCTDIYPFWNNGIDGVFFFESSDFGVFETPYYHTSNDLFNLSSNSMAKLTKTTQLVVASLATSAELFTTTHVEDYSITANTKNYPNPFQSSTLIYYQLKKGATVTLTVFDISGNVVAQLVDHKYENSGSYQVTFDASDLEGGLYFYRLTTDNVITNQKMVLIK